MFTPKRLESGWYIFSPDYGYGITAHDTRDECQKVCDLFNDTYYEKASNPDWY